MGGKSTYMRQNALIVLLAHIGSFVPASRALIGPIDRILTRIGAGDDLARGQSAVAPPPMTAWPWPTRWPATWPTRTAATRCSPPTTSS
ncbi:hypothetical protein G6F31_019853 [Rhizopus arrhizus]|nr:hypothetical protein G6F31_019853 [Rhizopus arrhizus]